MRSERVAGAILILLGLAVGREATTFNVYFLADPVGPKALPLLSALVFTGSGFLLAARPGAGPAWPARSVAVRMVAAVAAFAVYAALLRPVGFVVATTATVGFLSWLFGASWRRSLGAALGLSVALWYLFVWLLGLPLPLGAAWEAPWMR